MLAHVTGGLGSYRRRHVLGILLLWNIAIFVLFTVLYRVWGLKHVDLPAGQKPSWHIALYYAAITQYSFTPPYEPRDATARTLVVLHSTLSWISLFIIVFAPDAPGMPGTNPGAVFA